MSRFLLLLQGSGQYRMRRCWCAQVIAALFLSVCLPQQLYAFDFALWDAILKKNTRPSNHEGIGYIGFDYAATLNSRDFDKLVAGLASFSTGQLGGREEVMAFWINAYNIFAVKLVRENFPIICIKDVGSFISPVWDKPAGKVGGKIYSLNDIEHKILRPMNEPAIHFAIVCASVSCPDMLPEAYTPAALKNQLKSQVNRFLENKQKGMRIDRKNKTVHLSMIFDWYEKDFTPAGGIISFLNSELAGNRNIPADYAIKHLPYNWDLNVAR
ncbi:MAG: DUF547 domain-containing protein [Sulfuricellaceae bacterium]